MGGKRGRRGSEREERRRDLEGRSKGGGAGEIFVKRLKGLH